MAADRHSKAADFLEPDAKSQVTLAFENGRPVRATALVVSTQHSAALSNAEGQKKLRDYAKGVMTDDLPQGWMTSDEKKDRKSAVEGKGVTEGVDLGGRRSNT